MAERAGVPATTLRFYETAGLLPAARTAAGMPAHHGRSTGNSTAGPGLVAAAS